MYKNEFIMVLRGRCFGYKRCIAHHINVEGLQQLLHSVGRIDSAINPFNLADMAGSFHFIVVSIVFLNPVVGILAALIHFVIDVTHTILIRDMGELEHRALHFVIESLFFMLIYGL